MTTIRRVNWRTLACSVVCGFLGFLSTGLTTQAAIPASGKWDEVKVIDMHTHVFNARDLPLTGLLNALGFPRAVAVVVTEAMLASTPEDEGLPETQGLVRRVEHPQIIELTAPQRNILLDYVGHERWEPLQRAAEYLEVKPDVTLLAETLAQGGFPPEDNGPRISRIKSLTGAKELGDALKGLVRLIGAMTKQHSEIVALLRSSYTNTDLFVHHMMDMAVPYADMATVGFADQVTAMKKLDAAFPGKLLHFVAFDPFHRRAVLPFVKHAVDTEAAVGLKIYPPSGYRAAENATYGFPPKPGVLDVWGRQRWNARYAGWTERDLDSTLQGGFAWAAASGVPVFTHCTPHGFEAEKGYGWMADPFYWAAVLKKNENAGLRLCFGHSGGEAYWFSEPTNNATMKKNRPPGDAWQFGNQIVDLCLNYSNVYCEVGYLDPILDPKKAEMLVRRLESVINVRSKVGDWSFGDKLMFGTDWHMIYKEPNYQDYLAKWDEVIKAVDKGKSVDKGKWRQAFFAGNAKKFLRLEDLAKDPRFTADQQKELQKLSAAIP